jgi:hypothetical protein
MIQNILKIKNNSINFKIIKFSLGKQKIKF